VKDHSSQLVFHINVRFLPKFRKVLRAGELNSDSIFSLHYSCSTNLEHLLFSTPQYAVTSNLTVKNILCADSFIKVVSFIWTVGGLSQKIEKRRGELFMTDLVRIGSSDFQRSGLQGAWSQSQQNS